MLTQELEHEIEAIIGQDITTISTLSAANNAYIYRLGLEDKTSIVAKICDHGLDIENFMIDYLKQHSNLPLPNVLHCKPYLMIMEYIPSDWLLDAKPQQHAAELLAELHSVHDEQYGFEQDTLIGSLHQPNPKTSSWVKFYTEHRLLYMAQEALKEGVTDAKFIKKIEKLASRLPHIIGETSKPSLIHGDVWSGNVLPGKKDIKAFIDPAIYYADPEIELAFIVMFKTFGESFFRRYNEINPIHPGFFEERCQIYQLYPLLVHARLFGISYIYKAEKIIDKFL